MKALLMVLCISGLLTQAALAQLRHGDPAIRVIGTDEVNVRTEPRTAPNTLIMKIKRGSLMKRLDKRGGWYQVLLPNGQEAWMSGRYAEEVVARDLLEVIKPVVNVRSSASTASRQVDTAKQGDMLSMLRELNGWFQVVLPNGTSRGWVRNDMVIRHPLSPPEKTQTTAEKADAVSTPEEMRARITISGMSFIILPMLPETSRRGENAAIDVNTAKMTGM